MGGANGFCTIVCLFFSMLTYQTSLKEKKYLTDHVCFFVFEIKNHVKINFKPGQYVMLYVPQPDGKIVRRLYSIASSNKVTNTFELIVEIVPDGIGSTYLANIEPGADVIFQGAAGMFTLKEITRPTFFLATGTGIAPMRSMLLSLVGQPISQPLILLWGLKNFQDIYLVNEWEQLKRDLPQLHYVLCLSREEDIVRMAHVLGEHGYTGRITRYLNEQKIDFTTNDYYICGNGKVVEAFKDYLYAKQAPKEQVYFERYN